MSDLLSNAEIDGLLALFRSEGPPIDEVQAAGLRLHEPRREAGPVVTDVDLLKPNRIGREQIRLAERLFDHAAQALASTLGDKLRLDVSCDCVAVEQTRFSGWLETLSGRTVIYVVRMPPLPAPVLLAAGSDLLYGAVDRILGGTGRVPSPGQDFTAAEYTVADAFVGPCLDRLCESLRDLAELSWTIESRFANAAQAQILPAQDVLLAAHFQVSSELLPGDLRLGLPYAAIEPLLAKAELGHGPPHRVPPGALREVAARTVRSVPLSLSVVLGETAVPLRQLVDLAVGDVIPLPTRVGEPLVAPVQGRPVFLGQVGRQGSAAAFQVSSVLEP